MTVKVSMPQWAKQLAEAMKRDTQLQAVKAVRATVSRVRVGSTGGKG